MKKGILRYCKSSRIETVRSAPSRNAPDRLYDGKWWRIKTSLDPYLNTFGLFERDPLEAMDGKNVPYKCHILDYEEMASSAKHIVYYTYHWKSPTWISPDEKIIVCSYFAPSCILEMEIEFVYSSKRVFHGIPAEIDNRLPVVEWAGATEFAKTIHDETIEAFEGEDKYNGLNEYALISELFGDAKAESKYPRCQKIIRLVKAYDERIRTIAGASVT